MSDQSAAILRLLDDDDAATVALVQRKLSETESIDALRALHAKAAGRAAQHIGALIAELAQGEGESAFAKLCASFGEDGDLEAASWAMASALAPGEDFSRQRETLDAWGNAVAARLANARSKAERVGAIAAFLGREMRLRGNDSDYYSIDNSLLPRVVDSRLGIPISLALVYMLVGHRAGMQIDGVGLPGHFLARHEDVFFDPFHGGERIGLEECAAMMEGQNLVLTPQHLLPTTSRQMLLRMLTNVYYIAEQTDPPLAVKVSEWMTALRES